MIPLQVAEVDILNENVMPNGYQSHKQSNLKEYEALTFDVYGLADW